MERECPGHLRGMGTDAGARGAVVVVNPTKVDDLDQVRGVLEKAAAEVGAPTPRLVETTAEDPGHGQTRDAVADGADVVCALGGDGTVRAVAQELAGTGVPLGLLPGGTGNLLARNLDLPVDDLAAAARTAFAAPGAGGREREVDLGWLLADPTDEQLGSCLLTAEGRPGRGGNVHAFAVMAGVGFDAAMMADAPEGVKKVAGWAAYVASGAKHLLDRGFHAETVVDQGSEEDRRHRELVRGVVVGSCGELTGGVVLLPEARCDDGSLDVAVLSPRGLHHWADAAVHVLRRAGGDRPGLRRRQGRVVDVRLGHPQPYEVDGDVLGEASRVVAVVDPGGLRVRV